MSPTLRVDEPRELLALVPFQLGFQPTESVALVSLRHPEGRVGLVARADLADLRDDAVGRAVAGRLAGHLVADGAAALVMVVYTDGAVPREPDASCPVWQAVRTVSAAAGRLEVCGAWLVQPTGYRRLGCRDLGCCPVQGRPLDDLSATQVSAHMVLAGASVSASREDLGEVPRRPDGDLRRASAAGVAWTRARAADGLRGPAHPDWLERSLELWRLALDGRATAADLGQLAAALEDVVLRDAVLVSCVPGTAGLPEALVRSAGDQPLDVTTGRAVGAAVAAVVDPRAAVRPGEDAERARVALEQVVAHREEPSAPARTLLALLAWWSGDSALARAHLARGGVPPGYRLAQLLRRALDVGMPPGWAARDAA